MPEKVYDHRPRRQYNIQIRLIGNPENIEVLEGRIAEMFDVELDEPDGSVILFAGEIDVKVEDFGPVRVNENGYAIPLPSLH